MKKFTVIAVLLVLVSGCTNTRIAKEQASDAIGCSTSEITVKAETASLTGERNWIASCKGKDFNCTYYGGTGTVCKETKGN